jgi:hypothetical protein
MCLNFDGENHSQNAESPSPDKKFHNNHLKFVTEMLILRKPSNDKQGL